MKNREEILEEAAEKAYKFEADPNFLDEREYREFIRIFKRGANWQAKEMYTEEDLKTAFVQGALTDLFNTWRITEKDMAEEKFMQWFKGFKKK